MFENELDGSKVLGIFCHSDDEVICGWPIFQNVEINRHLLIICDDVARKGENRLHALKDVCNLFDIKLVMAGVIPSNFYRLPPRPQDADCPGYEGMVLIEAIREIRSMITQAILNVKPDYIFTHNPVGEYGHGDHRLLFQLVVDNALAANVLISDLIEKNKCHYSDYEIPMNVVEAYYDNHMFINGIRINKEFYAAAMATYVQYNAWTWKTDFNEESVADLYLLNAENTDV